MAVFAACLAGVTVLSVHKWWERRAFESTHFPTGLGDTKYYIPEDSHFEHPEIVISTGDGKSLPLFRHNINPVEKRDEQMRKLVEVEEGGGWFYADSRHATQEQAKRVYLKTAEGKYIEFRPTKRGSKPESTEGGAGGE